MPAKPKIAVPKKPNGRGYPRIKRSYGMVNGVFVGKINVSSGTDDPRMYQQLVSMLDMLNSRGDANTLIEIRDSNRKTNPNRTQGRQYHIQRVYQLYKANKHVSTIIGLTPAFDSLRKWVKTARTKTGKALSPRTIKSYSVNIDQLESFNAKEAKIKNPTDTHLPNLLRQYREYCVEREYWVPFNQAKTMLRSYARETQSEREDSDLYIALRRVPSLTMDRKRERKALQVWQVREIMAQLNERDGQHIWNMACLSVRPDEYASGCWNVVKTSSYGPHVVVSGTKTENAERVVPLAEGVKQIRFADSTFRRNFRKVVGTDYVPRDFRSTGKQWMKWAGIDPARIRMYFGHSMKGIEFRYDTHELLSWVASDAKLLNAYIEANMANPLTV